MKILFPNGNYYIGQLKNNIQNGKGKLIYKNENIKYDGDFNDDKIEGFGKFIEENGNYYIGQFKDNLKNGKEIEYSKMEIFSMMVSLSMVEKKVLEK